MINVGPTEDGIIASKFQKRLLQMGEFLDINGEAIYGTSPWFHQRDSFNPNVWYTCVKVPRQYKSYTTYTTTAVYAIFLTWPGDGKLKIKDAMSALTKKNCKIHLIKPNGYASVHVSIYLT